MTMSKSELPTFDDPQDLVNAVISTLQLPEENTHVAMVYSNNKNAATEVQAYAKIAGRDWTYYVKSLAILIGRNTDNLPPLQMLADLYVDIDLGPAKVVSRKHATITYNIDMRRWELKVLGRNGARVDGVKMPVGAAHATPLHTGAILDVGGTQMMFILPDAAPVILQKMLTSCLLRYLEEKHKAQQLSSSSWRQGAPHMPVFAAGATPQNMTQFGGLNNFHMFEKGSMSHPASAMNAALLQTSMDHDLSKDEARKTKPPYSYATMITQAILSNPEGVMSLLEIYNWISSHYSYYRHSKTGWQNSIRHNLSLNKAFDKVPRRPNEPGKGMKWQISDSYKQEFLRKVQNGTLLKSRRGSSVSRTLQIHLATHATLPEVNAGAKQEPDGARQELFSQQQSEDAHNATLTPYKPIMNGSYLPVNGYVQYGQYQPTMQQNQLHQQPHQQTQPQPQPPQLQPHPQSQQQLSHLLQQNMLLLQPQHTPLQQLPIPAYLQKSAESQDQVSTHGPGLMFNVPTSGSNFNSQPATTTASRANNTSDSLYISNSSHHPSTSESGHNSTAATTTNSTSELGLGFHSPKKVAPVEAFTPERGSKSNAVGKNGNGNGNAHQSSPAFWNFVQFSTPNGQTPGRKNSDESNGSGSPTMRRFLKDESDTKDAGTKSGQSKESLGTSSPVDKNVSV